VAITPGRSASSRPSVRKSLEGKSPVLLAVVMAKATIPIPLIHCM
jgi:hypothetical protein